MLIFKDISKYIGLFVSSCVVFVAVFLCASFMLPNISANATTEYESGYIYIYDVADSVTVFYSDETTEIVELVENSYVKISLEDVDQIYIDKSLTDDIYVSYDGGENYVSMSSVTETGCLNTAAINILIVANKSDAESTGNESTDNEPADENDGSSSGSGVTSTDDVGDNEVDKITITYNIDGELSTEDIEYGDAVSMDNPTKEGYEFLGWSTETSLYKGSAIFLEDVVLTAEFKAIDYVITVTASDGVEFSVASTAQIDESVEITYDLEAGYTLKSLSVSGGGQEIDVNDGSFIMPASDVSINIEADLYKISYKMEYYSSGSTYDFYYGEEISLVLNVDNMIFLGWFLDADFTEPMPQTAIGEEGETISVYPYFVEQYYTVTYVMADILMYYEDAIITYPADAIAETTVEYSDVFTADAPEETYEGNTFVGWYLDDLYETIAEEITIYENITLYAKYELETYTITYYYDEENSSVYTEEVAYLSALTPPETTDTDYYIFEEWIGDTTQLATADSVFFALYQQLYDNYYYCGDTLLGIVVGELSVVPEGDIDECECEGQTLTGFSLVYVSGTMAAYSAEHTANTYGIYYTNSTGATMSGSVFAQYEDTVYISYTLVTGYTFYMITSDEVELTLDDDGIYYYFIMPASDVYITIVTNKVTTTTTVTDTSSLTSSTISGQYSIRNNLEEEEVYIALSEGSVSEEQLATFILSLGTNTTTALSISLDLYDTDYNAIEFPDSTNLGITVPISSDLDIDSCTFSVVKLNTFSNEIYECKVFTIDEQNYVSFTVSDGGLYSILYTTVEVEDFTLTNFDVLLLTVGTLLFVVLIVVVARFIFAKKEIKRLNKLHKNM